MQTNIYLDCNATTPTDPEVVKAMNPYFETHFGNPSSTSHSFGRKAREAVEEARRQMACLLNCLPEEIYWTSGATESNNLAIMGIAYSCMVTKDKPHIITSETEHKAVLSVCEMLQKWGFQISFIKPNKLGEVTVEAVKKHIKSNTKLISIMAANNEIGTINPIEQIACLAKEHKIIMHTDAAQLIGKIPIDLKKCPVDILSVSGHKMYGPKGIGALYLKKGVHLHPIMFGGSQESEIRPGTLNVPGIVGLGEAARKAQKIYKEEIKRVTKLRQYIIKSVLEHNPHAQLNGHPTNRLPGNISLSFKNVSANDFFLGLSGLAYSSSSACSSTSENVSHVLTAIGLDTDLAKSTIRLGIGRINTKDDIDFAIKKINNLHKTRS